MNRNDRFRGCLLGLAVGDALGAAVEFEPPGTFEPVTDMRGGGRFGLEPGQWTDDTSLALCLAQSLIERRGFDPMDQMHRYLRWYNEGYMSSTGVCFDCGITTAKALHQFEANPQPYCGSSDPRKAGNGSLMRLAPVPMFFSNDAAAAIEHAALSSRTTHGATTAVDACRYFAGLIVGALNGASKAQLLAERYCPVAGYWDQHPLTPQIDEIAGGSFKRKNPPEIVGGGFAPRSLEAALWALASTDNFRDGCVAAVNLGDDADTTAAVFGQIGGAIYGVDAIPAQWREKIAMRQLIEQIADQLQGKGQVGTSASEQS
jgi:ADP-ribosylglycohydrolase